MKVKLCGFTEQNTLDAAIKCGVDFIGFVFCKKSPRYIAANQVAVLAKIIPSNIKKVAVLSNNNFDEIKDICANLKPDYLQFHGDEEVDFILEVKKNFPQIKIIKAFAVGNSDDLKQVDKFDEVADLFLFDSKKSSLSGSSGGNGISFDWNLLRNFESKKDWFLSGGLNIDNIAQALEKTGATMLDISSGIEKERGKKSPELITQLMKKIKNYA